MTEPMETTDPRVTARSTVRRYRLNEIGRAAVQKLITPDAEFDVRDLGVSDRVTLSVSVHIEGTALAGAHLDVPAAMLEEIGPRTRRYGRSPGCTCDQYDFTGEPIPCYC